MLPLRPRRRFHPRPTRKNKTHTRRCPRPGSPHSKKRKLKLRLPVQLDSGLLVFSTACETKTGRHRRVRSLCQTGGKRQGLTFSRVINVPKNTGLEPCATYPQICQGSVEKSKVIIQHSTPLTSLYAQRYLAVLFSPCDILNL